MILPDWAGYQVHRNAIIEATDQTLYPIEWLDSQLLTGRFKLWIGDNACIVAAIKFYPSGLADVEGIVAAGDASEIIESLIPQAEQWGRDMGCAGAIIESRAGWQRALKPYGYEPHQVAVRKVF